LMNGFNRTTVELKRIRNLNRLCCFASFNRTTVELKRSEILEQACKFRPF